MKITKYLAVCLFVWSQLVPTGSNGPWSLSQLLPTAPNWSQLVPTIPNWSCSQLVPTGPNWS